MKIGTHAAAALACFVAWDVGPYAALILRAFAILKAAIGVAAIGSIRNAVSIGGARFPSCNANTKTVSTASSYHLVAALAEPSG